MVAIDTNILVRFFTRDDQALATRADQMLAKAKSGSYILDRLILAELGYVLLSRYGYSREDVLTIYKTLLGEEAFTIPDREAVELTIQLYEAEKRLSFVDCWLLALRRNGKVRDVETFDADLKKRLKA